MKYLSLLLAACLIMVAATAQNRRNEFRLTPGCDQHDLYFAVKSSYDLRATDPQARLLTLLPALRQEINSWHAQLSNACRFSEEKLQRMQAVALANTGSAASVNKLRNIFKVSIPDPTNERLLLLAQRLEQIEGVDYASLHPRCAVLEPPAVDIAPTTPDLEPLQKYLLADPGVNMISAWDSGLTGTGIRVRDIEYGFVRTHEDLSPLARLEAGTDISGMVPLMFRYHGNSVMGILNAPHNGYGVSGMVPDISELRFYSEYTAALGHDRIAAITLGIDSSEAGDVILYEMQTYGPGTYYVPAEYDNVVWDLTKAATDANIIIVAAAGNGNQNLDSAIFNTYRARGHSGAIMVGAGTPDLRHNRLSFSTYGKRVDLQGWGDDVMSTGYGDYLTLGGDSNQTYTWFSGTSSATPIVASCVIALQGYYHFKTGKFLTRNELVDLLQKTGIPQQDTTTGWIGPLPDMALAFDSLKALMTKADTPTHVAGMALADCRIYPNPVQDKLLIEVPQQSGTLHAVLCDVRGKQLFGGDFNTRLSVDMSRYPSGMYFVFVYSGDRLLRTGKVSKL